MNTKKEIVAGQPWQIMSESVAFYAEEGGTLSFSVDGKTYADYDEAIEADTNVFLNGCVPGMFIKMTTKIVALS